MSNFNEKLGHYEQIHVSRRGGVATVVIRNPPVNVLGATLMRELRHCLRSMKDDRDMKVVVFESADPTFFLAHVDMTLGDDAEAVAELTREAPAGLNPFQAFSEFMRNLPQVTIVKLNGIARGGGAEFVVAADMAFASIGRGALAQCEALMGIIPGGGATQYLTHRMGRNRALEVILGADLMDAELLERYGWVNRALPASQLDGFVQRLADNIAKLPDGVIAGVKNAMRPAFGQEEFARETEAWWGLAMRPETQALMHNALTRGAQTPDGEKQLEDLLRSFE